MFKKKREEECEYEEIRGHFIIVVFFFVVENWKLNKKRKK